MNPFHVVLLVVALLLAIGAALAGYSTQPINRYAMPLICSALAVWFLDQLLVALHVYTA